MIYMELFFAFLRVGLFTFGGGYAAIPLIRDVVLSAGWLTEEALTNMIAVSESTPGPIMVNMATYVGSSQGGFWGALVATFAVVLPSFIVIQLILIALKGVLQKAPVKAFLSGMQACVVGIILATGLTMTGKSLVFENNWDIRAVGIAALLLALSFGGQKLTGKKINPIALILVSAVLGAVLYGI